MPVDAIALGDEIVVRPGEKIPLDGVVVTGHSDVNEAPLTGESRPIDKERGDEVYAGTINGRGAIERARSAARTRQPPCAHHPSRRDRADPARSRPVVRRSLCAHLYAGGSCARGCRCLRAAAGRRGAGLDMGVSRACAAGNRLPVRARDLDARVYRCRVIGGRQSRRVDQGRRLPGAPRRRSGSLRSTRPAR